MLETTLRLLAELGPATVWAAALIACVIVLFALYVGVAMVATLRATDHEQAKLRYRVFRDLLSVFRRGRRR